MFLNSCQSGNYSATAPVVLAPNVEHEDAGDEEQGHDQNWHRANLGMIHMLFSI